jgi:hypothetical protein
MQTRAIHRLPSLATALFGFVAIFAFLGLGALALLAERRLEEVGNRVQAEAVQLRGEALRMNFGKALGREWNSVNAVAGTIDMGAIEATRPRLAAISRISNAIAWTGIADSSGRLLASSRPLLEGQDVSGSLWFRRGLNGKYIGSAETDDRLARLVPGAGDGPVRFVDMSVAIRDHEGRAEGVLLYRLNVTWIQEYLIESAGVLELDLFLVNGRGDVLFEHYEQIGQSLSPRARQVVTSGQQGVFQVPLEQHGEAFLALLPKIVTGDMASLDRRLVARVPAQVAGFGLGSVVFSRDIFWVVLGFGAALVLGTALFARYFLAPLRTLSRDAEAIAEGRDTYPAEQRSSREAQTLSAAIVRLQRG